MVSKKVVDNARSILLKESDELQKAYDDVQKLIALLQSHERTNLVAYYTQEIARENRVISNIQRKLNTWIGRLEKGSEERLKEKLESIKNNLNQILVLGGELEKLIKLEDWGGVDEKIKSALGNPKKPGILALQEILNHLEEPPLTNNPFKILDAIEKDSKLWEDDKTRGLLENSILNTNLNMEELIELNKLFLQVVFHQVDKVENRDFSYSETEPINAILVKYFLIYINKNPKIKRVQPYTNKCPPTSIQYNWGTLPKEEIDFVSLYVDIYSNFWPKMVESCIKERNEINSLKLDDFNDLNSSCKMLSNHKKLMVFVFFALLKNKKISSIMLKYIIAELVLRCPTHVMEGFDVRHDERNELFLNYLITSKFFENIIVYELGGRAYYEFFYFSPKLHIKFKDYFFNHYITHEGDSDQVVGESNRVTLETYKNFYPSKADFTISSRVISYGSGMQYAFFKEERGYVYTDDYVTLELLTVFSNVTKRGGYSIHFTEVGDEIKDDEFLRFIGLKKVYTSGNPKVYQKINNKKISKEEFDKWIDKSKYEKISRLVSSKNVFGLS